MFQTGNCATLCVKYAMAIDRIAGGGAFVLMRGTCRAINVALTLALGKSLTTMQACAAACAHAGDACVSASCIADDAARAAKPRGA